MSMWFPFTLVCIGKDRTGLIAMLILSVLGATDDEIVKDYEMSDSVYQQLNDKKAKVVAIDQVLVVHCPVTQTTGSFSLGHTICETYDLLDSSKGWF